MTRDGNEIAGGIQCGRHFDKMGATVAEVRACGDCQLARQEHKEKMQRERTIDPSRPYGAHITLTCKNHPTLLWSTKNIDFIGARSIFVAGPEYGECSCPLRDLVVKK